MVLFFWGMGREGGETVRLPAVGLGRVSLSVFGPICIVHSEISDLWVLSPSASMEKKTGGCRRTSFGWALDWVANIWPRAATPMVIEFLLSLGGGGRGANETVCLRWTGKEDSWGVAVRLRMLPEGVESLMDCREIGTCSLFTGFFFWCDSLLYFLIQFFRCFGVCIRVVFSFCSLRIGFKDVSIF